MANSARNMDNGRIISPYPSNKSDTRYCPDCKDWLPFTEFYRDGRTRDGLTRRCKTHHSNGSYAARRKSERPHARRGYDRERNLRRNYGLSIADYEQIEAQQNGVCAICKQHPASNWITEVKYRLVVDHSHKTGKVRGLLCGNCNTGLGKFRDSPQILAAAIDYLERNEGEPCPMK